MGAEADTSLTVAEALTMDYGPAVDGRILAAQALKEEIDIYQRQIGLSVRAEVKRKCVALARDRLHLLRGLIALDPWITVPNIDLVDVQLSAVEAQLNVGVLSAGR